jgi:hypothetical protein
VAASRLIVQVPRGGRVEQLAAALDAVAHAERPVILAVLGDG